MERAPDTTLWEHFCQGDTRAFADLYDAHHSDLLWFGIQFCQDSELVRDEINQEFLQLWDRRTSLPGVNHVRNYLITSLRNRLVNALKKAGRPVPVAETEWASPSWEQELIGIEDRERLVGQVKEAIATLAPRQRELVFLRYYEGLTADAIARRTGLTTRTVYNTLNTALQKLRDVLGPRQSIPMDKLLSLLLVMY